MGTTPQSTTTPFAFTTLDAAGSRRRCAELGFVLSVRRAPSDRHFGPGRELKKLAAAVCVLSVSGVSRAEPISIFIGTNSGQNPFIAVLTALNTAGPLLSRRAVTSARCSAEACTDQVAR